jgi:hypothetical protein
MKKEKATTKEPVIVTHDSTATWSSLVEMKRLLACRPARQKEFRQRFGLFENCFVYERTSALRADRCTAGFQLTRELAEFISALRASEPEHDAPIGCGVQ